MDPSATPRGTADVTSTPKAHSPTSSRWPLLSPISPDESFSQTPPYNSPFFGTNIWNAAAVREEPGSAIYPSSLNAKTWLASNETAAPDSGFGPSNCSSLGISVSLASAKQEAPDSGFGPSNCSSLGTNISSLASAKQEARDSGFGPSRWALSFAECSANSFEPLSIAIPPPCSPEEAPSDREVMFAALDENFARYVRFVGRGRPRIGTKVGLPYVDIIACLHDSDPSGFILRTALLPLLSPCDLRRMRLVSSRWSRVVSLFAKRRYVRRVSEADENASPVPACPGLCTTGAAGCSEKGLASPSFLRCGVMRRTQPVASPRDGGSALLEEQRTPTLRERFESASSALLSSEHLARCPSCCFPARISPQRRSTHCESPGGCGAVLCRSCGYAQHESRPCQRRISPTREPALTTASSPEKRLRRRLLKRLSRDM